MSHFAKVLDGKVINVIVAEPEFFESFIDTSPGEWIQTSYNTKLNKHYDPSTGLEDDKPPLRGNYACVGHIYDKENDVFYAPQPFPSWSLNTTDWKWEPPSPYPSDGKKYRWNEEELNWVEIT